jgi:Right handed beta helix region
MRTTIRNLSIRIAITSLVVAAFMVPAQAASAAELCGSEITTPGATITLTEDLHCDGRGIIVRASNVTINLAGHAMVGDGSDEYDDALGYPAGIALFAATNTRIMGGTITGFANGLRVEHSNATSVQNLVINGTDNFGMIVTDSNGVALDHTTLTGPGHDGSGVSGIYGTNVSNFAATNTVISQWPDSGLYMSPVAGFLLSHSTVTENAGDGISVWNARGRVEINNSTFATNYNGVMLGHSGASGSVLISNSTMRDNVQHGLYTINVTNSRVVGVTANNNGGEGIWMDSGRDWTYGVDIPFYTNIQGSTANGNRHSGISLSFAGRWWLSGNRAESNGDSGFAFYGGEAFLTRNTAKSNDDDGFTWEDGSHGTSTSDSATNNHRNGVLLKTGANNTVTLTGTTATQNSATGLKVESGIAIVSGGSYSYNASDGIRASSGRVDANSVTMVKNGVNGIAFVSGAVGSVTRITSSKNGLYGICVDRSSHISDTPPHVLYANGVAPRGTFCTGFFLRPFTPTTTLPLPRP